MTKRRWKFFIETDNGAGYLDEDGVLLRDKSLATDWVGTNNAADKEADRRADAYEELTGLTCTRIVYESQGKEENCLCQR